MQPDGIIIYIIYYNYIIISIIIIYSHDIKPNWLSKETYKSTESQVENQKQLSSESKS